MKKSDYLKYINKEIVQDDEIYKVNSDTTILGMSMDMLKGKNLLDIGCNTGGLLLYGISKGAKTIYGVDLNEKALELAEINLKKENCAFKLYHGDVRNLELEKVDAIVCNPPFFEMNNVTPNENLRLAMFEESLPLNDLFDCFRRLMKDSGEVYMIYPADRFPELYAAALSHKMKIMKMRFVHDDKSEFALRVVLKLKVGPMTKVRVLKPIIIRNGEFEID